jgi:hypothetical protein
MQLVKITMDVSDRERASPHLAAPLSVAADLILPGRWARGVRPVTGHSHVSEVSIIRNRRKTARLKAQLKARRTKERLRVTGRLVKRRPAGRLVKRLRRK